MPSSSHHSSSACGSWPGAASACQSRAHAQVPARFERVVIGETRALLGGGAEAQRVFVPSVDLRAFRRRDRDAATVCGAQGRVAAAVVGVQVGVHDTVQRTALQRVAYERQRLRGVRDVTGVDERRVKAAS